MRPNVFVRRCAVAAPRPPRLFAVLLGLALVAALGAGPGCAGRRAQDRPLDPGEPEMRIRVAKEQSEANFNASSDLEFSTVGVGGRRAVIKPPVTVRLSDSGWVVRDTKGAERGFDRTQPLIIRAMGATIINYQNFDYPGSFRLHSREDLSPGVFDVVEHVPMEMYIPGVVSKELPQNWSAETYKAQAIAARSYAMHERQRRMARGEVFDLEATDRDQVYGGFTAYPGAVEGTRSTKGMVVKHNGFILRCYYSSTCGGRAASAREIWPTGRGFEFNLAAPLQSHQRESACERSPFHRWTVERDTADVVRRLAAYGAQTGMSIRNIKSLSRIQATKFNPAGRPTHFQVFDAQGKSWTLGAEHLRMACNHTDGPSNPPVTRETRVHSSDFEAVVRGNRVQFNGRGWGHGVGMCQFCAEGFAARGEKAEAMLARFYPGTQVAKDY